MVNPVDGAVTARYEYDPFGKTIVADGIDAAGNAVRFSTKYWDGETDLVYFGYRYYLSELGRWVSQDPIEERGGKNLFAFVLNNPLSESDYLGLYIEEDEKQYEYTAKNGIAAHKLIMKHVDIYYNGEPIDDISSTEWDLKFDQPLNILGLGFSNRRPDIISETICRKLIWEIKPITHIKRFDLLEKDYDQIDGYLSSLNDHSYYYGEAIIFFPTSNLTIGVIEGEKDIKYEVKVISNHDRIGLIFYKLEKIWWDDDNPFDHWKKELEKGPNPLLYLILSLLGGSSGIPVPIP
jgi:RHS repeat-associated protein